MKNVYKFSDRNRAFNFASHCVKSMWVILGDDDKFWVVRPVDFERLLHVGYESAI